MWYTGPWTVTGVVMRVSENDDGNDYTFLGAQLGYTVHSDLGEGNYRILVDHARRNRYRKRGGGLEKISLDQKRIPSIGRDPDLVALDEALTALAEQNNRRSRVVELRFFGGLSIKETAEVLGVCSDTVVRDWRLAKIWLVRRINKEAMVSP